MAKLPFALRGPGPPLDRKLWEIQRFPKMETWYEKIIWIKEICLWTYEERFYQPHQRMNSPFVALAWVLRVAHRLPKTDFSPAKEQISTGASGMLKALLGGRQTVPIGFTLAIPGQGRLCAAQTPSSYSHRGRGASQAPRGAARAPAGAEGVWCTGRAAGMQPENKRIMVK